MTPEETVRAIAARNGVNPDLAVSLWQQESGKSTDTGLRGQELSGDRGAAVGPFQVVPYYHPQFPVNGTFEEQADYATKYLKQVGPARYYGTGNAPPGHPTTEQYVNQVMSRVPPDVRMAGSSGIEPPTGDPRTGRMDIPNIPLPPRDLMAPENDPPASAKGLLSNPLAKLALGAIMTGGKPLDTAIVTGGAIDAQSAAEQALYDLRTKRNEDARKQRMQDSMTGWFSNMSQTPGWEDVGSLGLVDPQQGAKVYSDRVKQIKARQEMQSLADQYRRMNDPLSAAKVEAGITTGLGGEGGGPKYGVAANYVFRTDAAGNRVYYAAKRNDQGGIEYEPLPEGFTPFQDPEFIQQQRAAGAAGNVLGEQQATAAVKEGRIADNIQETLSKIDTLIADPNREYATGWQSNVEWLAPAGTGASDYRINLKPITSEAFLANVDRMARMGQLTEKEGAEIKQAATSLDYRLSDKAHLEELKRIKRIFTQAQERAQKAAKGDFSATPIPPAASPSYTRVPAGSSIPSGVTVRRVEP